MKVLITGGAGYIGSTVASACIDAGITPIILDNLSTGSADFVQDRIFYQGDVGSSRLLAQIFAEHPDIEATIHCAALASVEDSVRDPLAYYRENVAKTTTLLEALLAHGCHRLIFSSSAAIYRADGQPAISESAAIGATSPYGRTKVMAEQMFADVSASSPLRVISLRYFNPIGADPRMRSGRPGGRSTHALGLLIQAYQHGAPFTILGDRYETRDGTGLRDYVHVWDLALGHVAALRRFDTLLPPHGEHRYEAINLGSGNGATVRELVAAFESVVGRRVWVRQAGPRAGDVPGAYARTDKAGELLGWHPTLTLPDGIRSALEWAASEAAKHPVLVPAQS
jgi:UDP-glucose 4-epimerase